MTRIYAVANQKGGGGKSTTAVSVAAYLAEWGRRTLLIDIDPQGNATSGLGFERDPDRPSVYDVLIAGRAANEAVIQTPVPGLDLLPSDLALAGAELELIDLRRGQQPISMRWRRSSTAITTCSSTARPRWAC